MFTRARPRVRRKFTRLPWGGRGGRHGARVRGFLAASPSPTCTPTCISAPPYLAHVLHDDVESLVQDHAQQTHQVLMLHLPVGRQKRG